MKFKFRGNVKLLAASLAIVNLTICFPAIYLVTKNVAMLTVGIVSLALLCIFILPSWLRSHILLEETRLLVCIGWFYRKIININDIAEVKIIENLYKPNSPTSGVEIRYVVNGRSDCLQIALYDSQKFVELVSGKLKVEN